jgi:hypothetical protein
MFKYDYPDVLGTITGGVRHEFPTLQIALGVYPSGSAIGQPFEVLVVLQSTIDKPQEIALALRLPRKDAQGRRLSFFVPRKQIKMTLNPGDVGVMQLPIVAEPPTPPNQGYPLMLKVLTKAEAGAQSVRSPGMGRPPSALSVSPFRLEVLREVPFTAEITDEDLLHCRFNVIPGNVKVGLTDPQAKYEVLWGSRDFEAEQGRIEAHMSLAERVAVDFSPAKIFYEVEEALREYFAAAGLPLHPGESLFMAKTVCYIFEDAYQYEQNFDLHDARWFHWLCSLLVRDEDAADLERGKLAAGDLFFAALYDSVRVGLPMVEHSTGSRYGTVAEHRRYADKVIQAVQGNAPIDLSYAYLPLIMAGVQLNMRVQLHNENLWANLDLLEEALRGRARLAVGKQNPIFDSLGKLLGNARDLLHRSRIPRE